MRLAVDRDLGDDLDGDTDDASFCLACCLCFLSQVGPKHISLPCPGTYRGVYTWPGSTRGVYNIDVYAYVRV